MADHRATTVLVEGPDGSGKTTFITEIQRHCAKRRRPFFYFHNGLYPSADVAYEAYTRQLTLATKIQLECAEFGKEAVVVYDRGALSELVYGKVMRDTHTDDQFKQYVGLTSQLTNFKFVLCRPDLNEVTGNWKQRLNDEYIQRESKLKEVYASFQWVENTLANSYLDNFIRYDYRNTVLIDALQLCCGEELNYGA